MFVFRSGVVMVNELYMNCVNIKVYKLRVSHFNLDFNKYDFSEKILRPECVLKTNH